METNKRTPFLFIILIIILGFFVYANSLSGKFIWDDVLLVRDNISIRHWSGIIKFFSRDIGEGSEKQYYSYRPLQMLTYTLNYSLWELDPKGYHLTNIILHILVALTIYWFINILYSDRIISFLCSILFVAHPINTEAVAYISGRADPLSALFLFLSFIFYVKFIRTNAINMYFLVLLGYLLAILSKESALILPVLLLFYHYIFKARFKFKYFLPILSITFLYILMRLTVLSYLLPPRTVVSTNLWQRLPGIFVALANYIKLLFLPFNLHMEYGGGIFRVLDQRAIAGVIIFILLATLAFLKRKGNRLVSFSIFWFFISLLPQSNIYPVNAYMAEHWLYLSSMGFFLILGSALKHLCKAGNLKNFAIALSVFILIFYSILTVQQNNYWKEPIAFYERTLKFAPESWRVLYNLGNAYIENDMPEKATEAYKKAIEIKPNYAEAYNGLGTVIGNDEEAIAYYKKAIEINPNYAKAYNNLANIYRKIGKPNDAIALYKKAIEIKPDYTDAYFNLGLIYASIDSKERAIASFKKAIEINPNYTKAYNNLADIYEATGKPEEAITTYKQAIKFNPSYAYLYNNLGILLYALPEKRDEAIDAFKKAVEIDVNLADAHNNLAVAHYYYKKEYALAVRHCEKAMELGYKVNPEFLKLLQPFKKPIGDK